jgi:subtilase family serine protease
MSHYKRRAWPGMLIILSLLAGFLAPALIPASDGRAMASTSPDLVAELVIWSPESPTIGDMVTFSAVILNRGDGPAGPFSIAYYIDENPLKSAYVDHLSAGAAATNTFVWKAKAGAHLIRAVVDSEGSIAESNEDNNDKTFAFSVLAPDLVVDGISWTPENPSIGQKVTFTVTVKNQGNKKAGASSIDLYLDGSLLGSRSVPWLDIGDNATATYTLTAISGSHAVEAVADSLHQVNESDETNNTMTVTYSTAAPDLVIDAITFGDRTESSNVTATVTIKNQGKGTADSSLLALYIDDVFEATAYISRLGAGATTAPVFSYYINADAHTFKAVADVSNLVAESDESNNTRTANLSALAPDLVVESITWSPTQPLIAHQMTFTITIKNQGTRQAGSFDLDFYINEAYKFHQPMASLPAGDTTSITIPWVTQAELITARAVVDVDNYIKESDESNNTMTANVGFTHPAPATDLTIQDMTCTPASPSIGETVTITVNVNNQGPGQARPSHIAYYVDDAPLGSVYLNQIDPGSTANNSITWQVEDGKHQIKAVIDCNNSVAETDESNNEQTVTITSSAPDLTIQDITWSPSNPAIGDDITFTLTIKNQGNHKSDSCYITYYVDNSYRGNHYIDALEPGAITTRAFTWKMQAASHIFKAIVDEADSVLESNKSNNEKIVVLPAPDLTIDSITCSPDNPSENTLVTFTINIRNLGSGPSGSTLAACYIDGKILTFADIDGIGPGKMATGTFTWIARSGEHVIKVVADESNNAIENDEYNNEKEVTISISLPAVTEAPAPEPVPEATPAVTSEPKAPEPAAATMEKTEVPPSQDKDTGPVISANISQAPPSPPGWQGILMNRWLIIGIGVAGAIAIVVLFGLRKKTAKK